MGLKLVDGVVACECGEEVFRRNERHLVYGRMVARELLGMIVPYWVEIEDEIVDVKDVHECESCFKEYTRKQFGKAIAKGGKK